MARPPEILQWPAAMGLDQFSDERHVEPVQLLNVENARFRKRGRLGKRYGTSLITQSPTGYVTGDGRVYANNGQVLVGDGASLYSYTPNATNSSTAEKLPTVGTLPQAQITRTGVWSGTSPYVGDIAYGSNCYCVCWLRDADLYFEVYDTTTGAPFGYGQTVLVTGVAYTKCAFLSGAFYVAVSYTGTTNIDVLKVPITGGPAATTTYNIITTHVANASFAFVATSAKLVVAYQNGASFTPRVSTFTAAGVLSTGPTDITEAIAARRDWMTMSADASDNAYVAYQCHDGANGYVRYGAVNATSTALVLAATTVVTHATDPFQYLTIYRDSATTAVIAYWRFAATGEWTNFATLTSGGTVTALTGAIAYWCKPVSGFFKRASGKFDIWLACGGAFAGAVYASATQRSTVLPATAPTGEYARALVTLSTASTGLLNRMPHGVADPRIALFNMQSVPSVVSKASGNYATVQTSLRDGYQLADVAIEEADFTDTKRWQGATVGKHLFLSGGTPTIYDGTRLREVAFAYNIQGPWTRTINGAGGSFPANSNYFWCFVYRRTDGTGQVLRGSPSTPMDTRTAANDEVVFTLPTLSMTPEPYNGTAAIECYRTVAGGSIFYLVETIQNATFVPTVTFTDDYSVTDAALVLRPQLYTTGGTLENVLPPASVAVFGHKQRAFFCERDRIWYSKLYLDGEFPGFSDESTIDLPGGNIVAACSLDDFAVLFERNRIWRLMGEGPNDQGLGGDYQLTAIATELGCIDPGSVIVWSGGVFFRSAAGLYNLNRGLQVEYLGKFVEDELDSATTIRSAIVHPTEHLILFALSGGATQRRLAFDYLHGQWLKDVTDFSNYGLAVNGTDVYMIDGDANLRKELTSSHLDVSAWVTMRAKYGFVKMTGGLLGYQRIRGFEVQCEWMTAHGITVQIYNDFSSMPETAQSWTEAQVTAFPSLPMYSVSAANKYPLGNATAIAISDVASSPLGTGEGFALLGIAVDGNVEQGLKGEPGAQKR